MKRSTRGNYQSESRSLRTPDPLIKAMVRHLTVGAVICLILLSGIIFSPSMSDAAVTCTLNGPGNRTFDQGIPGASFAFSASASGSGSAAARLVINVSWGSGSPPGITGTVPAPAQTITYNFSGTPTTVGTYTYTASLSDNASKCSAYPPNVSGTITVRDPAALEITTSLLGEGRVNEAYSRQVVAAHGVTPYTWDTTAGSFPAGLAMTTGGLIAGTPALGTQGDYTITFRVTDNVGTTATKTLTLTILPPPVPLAITTISLPQGTVNIPYSYTVTATGGTTPYAWSISAGSLPPGLVFTNGAISGTPTTANTYSVTIRVVDSVGTAVTRDFTIVINAAAVVITSSMTDYCVAPPFIKPEVLPNLLLMIDNSSSMYDLSHIDKGVAGGRAPYYCYDKTFRTTNSYYGYFDETKNYQYIDANFRFEEVAGFPGACNLQIPSSGSAVSLCIQGTNLTGAATPKVVTAFYASGKYLNWLTASKFDVEKKILTGGKYDTGNSALIGESRGCVGRRYVKEPITADYVEGGTNTDLGITIGVRGPLEATNPSSPSPGGQTFIEIFFGNYNESACQTAIDIYADPTKTFQDRRDATALCVQYDRQDRTVNGTAAGLFTQSVQECYQYDLMVREGSANPTVGTDALNITNSNFCPSVYDAYSPGHCSATLGQVCSLHTDCPGTERCISGPFNIGSASGALLCSSSYAGACYVGPPNNAAGGFTGSVIDGGVTYTGNDCVIHQHNKYCGDVSQPPVVDPTDDPSATDFFANVPAILGGTGLQSQLGNPIKEMLVRVHEAGSPIGIIQDYKGRIRFGAESFDFNGSSTECSDAAGSLVKCPRVCSTDRSKTCASSFDCANGATCVLVSSTNQYHDPVTNQDSPNQNGGKIISHIGDPTYAANPVGDHNAGLIRAIDDIRAQTWTPFSEGIFNAVAYYSQNTTNDGRPYRLNDGDFTTTTNPITSSCQRNNILLLTDGMSTTDQSPVVMTFAAAYNDGDGQTTATASASGSVAPKYFGSKNVDDIAWYAQNKNIFNPASTAAKKPKETIKTYVSYTGEACDPATTLTDCTSCTSTDETQPERLMLQTAANGGGSCSYATDAEARKAAIKSMFDEISGTATSGTAASVLASGEGSGANLIQAVFYPERIFDPITAGGASTAARWLGRLTNLWYFVDPRFDASGIYEDNDNDKVLDLTSDYRVKLKYDAVAKKTLAERARDMNNDGVPETAISPDIDFELLSSLWDAGLKLWKRTSARRILTTTGGGITNFSTADAGTLYPYLQTASAAEGANIINYVHGIDGGNRSRTVQINAQTRDDGTHLGAWKLGDVIQSTPRIASRFPLNTYDLTYIDSTYKLYVQSTNYLNRGLVFAGANDGMLHAFYLGKLDLEGADWKTTIHKKARLTDAVTAPGVDLGTEVWSFIPKNVLPYLKYMADPNYCHVYSVDLTPVVFDAAIGAPADGDISNNTKVEASWRTILIGGMRLGGACRASDSTCTNCVKAPGVDLNGNGSVDTDPERTLGMSSYFALDITNTLNDPTVNPELLWEYSASDLGMTSSGPAIVKINMKAGDTDGNGRMDGGDDSNRLKNGKYYVVFASGPTGTISTADHQFMGSSDQELTMHIMELKSGPAGAIWKKTTGKTEAFGGSIVNATMDTDLDYQDDVLYIPYVQKCTSTTTLCTNNTWTDGGVGRLLTREDLDPTNWEWSTLIDNTGPVTAAVAKLLHQRKGKLWTYFGTGRYFFEQETPDDANNQRRLYGVKDPCYSVSGFESSCGSAGGLTNVTNIASVPTTAASIEAMSGWYINMAASSAGFRAERVITDPLATLSGLVIFTTFQPKDNNCEPGGRSFLWATKYDTGGAGGALLKGKGLLQVSTGSIEDITLSESAFAFEGGRKTVSMEGVPPTAQGLSLLASPPPVERTIHIKER